MRKCAGGSAWERLPVGEHRALLRLDAQTLAVLLRRVPELASLHTVVAFVFEQGEAGVLPPG